MLRFRCTAISPGLRRVTVEAPCGAPRLFSTFGLNMSTGASCPAAPPVTRASTSSTASFSRVFRTKNLPLAFRRPFVCAMPTTFCPQGTVQQRRMSSTSSEDKKGGGEEGKSEGGEKKEGGEEKEGGEKDGEKSEKDGEKKAEEKKPGFFSNFTGLKEDLHRHPDVYNFPNMMNLLLFSIFCLASTGSNVEADWWVGEWGIDAAFKPWTWVLHSWMTNNLPPMAFAMMLIHSMAHSVHANLGNIGLMKYCAMVSIASGFAMWAYNAAIGQRGGEKQFGPWDICAALFVMQYLHQGITPFAVLSGFQSWLRYASFVGAALTLYYNPQPTTCGTVVGLVLCKSVFKAPIIKATP